MDWLRTATEENPSVWVSHQAPRGLVRYREAKCGLLNDVRMKGLENSYRIWLPKVRGMGGSVPRSCYLE